jgi:YD repeat-containing protein
VRRVVFIFRIRFGAWAGILPPCALFGIFLPAFRASPITIELRRKRPPASAFSPTPTTVSTYDFAGNLIETAYPDGTVSRTAYNADGHPQYVQDRTTNNTATIAPATRTTYDVS